MNCYLILFVPLDVDSPEKQSASNSRQLAMQTLTVSNSLAETLQRRRRRLAERVDFPVVLWSGNRSSRNFPANTFPFRASSHFLYFAGVPLANAAIRLEGGKLTLFMDEPMPDDLLWHGPTPTRQAIAAEIGAAAAYPFSALEQQAEGAATLAVQDAATYEQQAKLLARDLALATQPTGHDLALAKAIAQIRLVHDAAALTEIRKAAVIAVKAHRAGMAATPIATWESEVRAAMESIIMSHGMTCAYSSIVTVHGEVLHNEQYHHSLEPNDLLLADLGAEAATGWASDVTRTWPVSGQFSSTQRDLYDVVLAAHDACIAKAQPGMEYRDLHLLACQVMAEGLVDLGILQGLPSDLVEQDAHALFFPHGVGHLLGLDVHDMEDLGDLAGYAEGRTRSDRFGLSFLRLDRPLQAGMAVTIEPGFYQVPAILQDPERRAKYQDSINWDRLAQFADVRGIRIEDDVLITDGGVEVLTADLPTTAGEIEGLIGD